MRRFLSGERSESGETLIEVIIASALMGIVVVAIVGGVSTMLLGSKVNRDQANANSYLVSAMEHIKSTDFPRWKCGDPSSPEAVYQLEAQKVVMPAGWVIAITPADPSDSLHPVQFEFIDGAGGTPAVKFGDTCDEATPLQLIALKVTSADTRVAPTLAFVKGAG